jgi:hypothetical protein
MGLSFLALQPLFTFSGAPQDKLNAGHRNGVSDKCGGISISRTEETGDESVKSFTISRLT